MTSPLIFIPHAVKPGKITLDAVGLGDHGEHLTCHAGKTGPEGGEQRAERGERRAESQPPPSALRSPPSTTTGVMCTWYDMPHNTAANRERRADYLPDEQTWIPAALRPPLSALPPPLGAGRYWVGVWNNSPPSPADLRRSTAMRGHDVTLGDGQQWTIPALNMIPRSFRRNAHTGEVELIPLKQYDSFAQTIEDWFQAAVAADGVKTLAEHWDLAVFLLKQNYRLTDELIGLRELLTTQNIRDVIDASLDLHLMKELLENPTHPATPSASASTERGGND